VPDRFSIPRIASAVRARAPKYAVRDEPFWEAAVAIVLREGVTPVPDVLFIERAVREGDPWSGQVALPGGRRNEGESDLLTTAVRETMEETGLDLRAHGEVFGPIDEFRTRSPALPPVIVRPFVARINAGLAIAPSDEVSSHFWVPLDALFNPANTRPTRVVARGFSMWRDAIHYEGKVIWGMTEIIVRTFQEVAG